MVVWAGCGGNRDCKWGVFPVPWSWKLCSRCPLSFLLATFWTWIIRFVYAKLIFPFPSGLFWMEVPIFQVVVSFGSFNQILVPKNTVGTWPTFNFSVTRYRFLPEGVTAFFLLFLFKKGYLLPWQAWAFGLVVWFSLRVREVPSSILGMPLHSCILVISTNSLNLSYLSQTFFPLLK